MKFWYKAVKYGHAVRVADQASAINRLTEDTIILVMPGDLPKSLKMFCPCGCKEVLNINLMKSVAKAWQVTVDLQKGFSLWPSVWRDTGCKSHFVLRNNVAWLLYGDAPQDEDSDFWERLFSSDGRA